MENDAGPIRAQPKWLSGRARLMRLCAAVAFAPPSPGSAHETVSVFALRLVAYLHVHTLTNCPDVTGRRRVSTQQRLRRAVPAARSGRGCRRRWRAGSAVEVVRGRDGGQQRRGGGPKVTQLHVAERAAREQDVGWLDVGVRPLRMAKVCCGLDLVDSRVHVLCAPTVRPLVCLPCNDAHLLGMHQFQCLS